MKIAELTREDRRQTIHELCEMVGIGYVQCQAIPTEDLQMHCVTAKFVPRLLTADQKQRTAC